MNARFFCETCGAEVSAGAESCPRCGKIFTAVRCPRCGFEGSVADFGTGCPTCGYMEPSKPSRAGRARQTARQMAPRKGSLPRGFYRGVLLGLAVAALGLLVILLLTT